jgi:hypothetical protein
MARKDSGVVLADLNSRAFRGLTSYIAPNNLWGDQKRAISLYRDIDEGRVSVQ